MIKRLPYLALAVILAISTCVLMGGKVRAASPIFYDGVVTWNIGSRLYSSTTDFEYRGISENLPVMRTQGIIMDELGAMPWNGNYNTLYTKLPMYISVHSRDLMQNGGYIYLAYAYAYETDNSIQNVTVTSGSTKAYRHYASNLQDAVENGTELTVSKGTIPMPNTVISESYQSPSIPNLRWNGFSQPDGNNFAQKAWFIGSTQELDDQNISYQFVYDYGNTGSGWNRTVGVVARVTVPAFNITTAYDRSVVWIQCENVFQGSFRSRESTFSYLKDGDDTPTQITLRGGSIVYLLPLYCYATSSSNYEEVEMYLASILSQLNNGSMGVDPSVASSYARLGQEARQAASEAVAAMSAAAPSFQASDYDVFDNVDSVAMQQFSSIVGFLSLRRILPILLAALALVTIGYLFFGKK